MHNVGEQCNETCKTGFIDHVQTSANECQIRRLAAVCSGQQSCVSLKWLCRNVYSRIDCARKYGNLISLASLLSRGIRSGAGGVYSVEQERKLALISVSMD